MSRVPFDEEEGKKYCKKTVSKAEHCRSYMESVQLHSHQPMQHSTLWAVEGCKVCIPLKYSEVMGRVQAVREAPGRTAIRAPRASKLTITDGSSARAVWP